MPGNEVEVAGDSPGAPALVTDDEEDRALGAAAILGAVRGALAGGSLALVALSPFALVDGAHWLPGAAFAASGLAFSGAVFSSGNAVAARLRGHWLERFVLFVAGTATPFVFPAPIYAITRTLGYQHSLGDDIFGFVVFGVAGVGLGIGLALSGAPYPAPTLRDEMIRARDVVSCTFLVVLVPLLVTTWCGGALVFPLVAYPFAWAYALAFVVAKKLTRPLAAWLEPGASALDRARTEKEHDAHVDRCLDESRRARGATPEERPVRLAAALDAARLALEVGRRHRGWGGKRAEDVRRVATLIFDLESAHDLELLVRELPDLEALQGELRRIQGDARAAEELARAALARSPRRAQVRANGHAVLALALADQGRCDEALVHVREARSAQRIVAPALERFEAAYLRGHVERRRAAVVHEPQCQSDKTDARPQRTEGAADQRG